MIVAARVLMLALALVASAVGAAAADEGADGKKQQIDQLMELHDLTTSVSIGSFYLKQEGLIAIRSLLVRLGKEEKLGPDWNARDPQWQRAEDVLLRQVAKVVDDFSNLDWLRPHGRISIRANSRAKSWTYCSRTFSRLSAASRRRSSTTRSRRT